MADFVVSVWKDQSEPCLPGGDALPGGGFRFSSQGISSVVGTTWTTKISLTTVSPLPAGTYEVRTTYLWALSAANQSFEARQFIDGVGVGISSGNGGIIHRQEPKDPAVGLVTDQIQSHIIALEHVQGSDSTIDYDLEFRGTSGGVTAAIAGVVVDIKPIS